MLVTGILSSSLSLETIFPFQSMAIPCTCLWAKNFWVWVLVAYNEGCLKSCRTWTLASQYSVMLVHLDASTEGFPFGGSRPGILQSANHFGFAWIQTKGNKRGWMENAGLFGHNVPPHKREPGWTDMTSLAYTLPNYLWNQEIIFPSYL